MEIKVTHHYRFKHIPGFYADDPAKKYDGMIVTLDEPNGRAGYKVSTLFGDWFYVREKELIPIEDKDQEAKKLIAIKDHVGGVRNRLESLFEYKDDLARNIETEIVELKDIIIDIKKGI